VKVPSEIASDWQIVGIDGPSEDIPRSLKISVTPLTRFIDYMAYAERLPTPPALEALEKLGYKAQVNLTLT